MPHGEKANMIRRADLLVIGGGIAGLSTALAAAERQLRVLIVDDARPGAASAAAAGMLAPSLEAHSPAVRAVAMDARDAYPDFLARLRERANIDVALNRHGILELASSASDLAVLTSRAGPEAQSLDAHELAKAEPAFAGHAGAVLHPKDGSVDNVALMHALAEAVVREPRIDRLSDRVTSLDVAAARPTASTALGERIECARILLASGAWAAGIAGLPRVIPVHPVRGELLLLACAPISHVTYGSGGYLVPRGQTLLIGATSEAWALRAARPAPAEHRFSPSLGARSPRSANRRCCITGPASGQFPRTAYPFWAPIRTYQRSSTPAGFPGMESCWPPGRRGTLPASFVATARATCSRRSH